MNKKILFSLIFLFDINLAFANEQNYQLIIQRQAKQITNLENRLGALENNVSYLKNQLQKQNILTQNDTDIDAASKIGAISGESNVEGKPVLQDDQKLFFADKSSTGQDKLDYDLALAALKSSKFEAAEQKFSEFISNHPNSTLQENATFWYAETFYQRGMFNKAAINYLQGYKKYPKGSKAADSLLKLSLSLGGLNKNKEACSMLEKLDLEFPNRSSASIKRAKDAKSKFSCK